MLRAMVEQKYTRFQCPKCQTSDVAYIDMPEKCYNCGLKYRHDLNKMFEDINERLKYHFDEEI